MTEKPSAVQSMESKNKSRTATAPRTRDGNPPGANAMLPPPAGGGEITAGAPFLDHMLDSFARHGFFDLRVEATGDLHIDDHHTVEDVGIVIGRAFSQALGDRSGIRRFGSATVPLDEALCTAVVDISGRAYLAYNIEIREERVGKFQTILVHDFMKAITDEIGMNLH